MRFCTMGLDGQDRREIFNRNYSQNNIITLLISETSASS